MWQWFLVPKYVFHVSVTCWLYLRRNLLLSEQIHLLLPSVWTWSLCFLAMSHFWPSSSCPSPSLLAAGSLVFSGFFQEVTRPVLTGSDGNTAIRSCWQGGRLSCLPCSDGLLLVLSGRVGCWRALHYEVKLQAVLEWTNTQFCLTW